MPLSNKVKKGPSPNPEIERQLQKEIEILAQILKEKTEQLETLRAPSKDELIPLAIFSNDKLSSLETIVKFLKENRGNGFSEIATMLNRDPRTIWATYAKARGKQKAVFKETESAYHIPLSIVKNRTLGVLESICMYMKDSLGLTYHEIAVALRRNDRTIWASYHNAKNKKHGKNKE